MKGQITLQEWMKPDAIQHCGKCVCGSCMLWESGRCPYGDCYDDHRAAVEPYDKAHPNQPPEPPKTESPKIQEPEETEATAPDEKRKYTGFLHIKCPYCGNVKSFCSKNGVIGVSCNECGNKESFKEPLRPLYVNCECGERKRYLTNRTEEMFDIECFDCGTPVAVKYNAKKGIYETIR